MTVEEIVFIAVKVVFMATCLQASFYLVLIAIEDYKNQKAAQEKANKS